MSNPFYWLEIRIRASEKRIWIIALFFLISILLIGGGILLTSVIERYSAVIPGELGQGIMYTLLFWQGAVLVVLAPLASAGRISQEREQRTLPALINTSVNPSSIVWGKLKAAWVFILWLASFVLPFIGIGLLWGGLPVWKVISFILINIGISMVIAAIALGFSGLMGRSLTAYLVTGAFLLGWMVVLPIVGSIAMTLHNAWGKGAEEIIFFTFFYHNPFFPTILIAGNGFDLTPLEITCRLIYCFVIWVLLAHGGVWMARNGLQKEVY